jgi:hypothetical protein
MNRSLRVVLRGQCLGALVMAMGCQPSTPHPLPDAGLPSALTLTAEPNPLVVRPGSSGRVRFAVRDAQGEPVGNHAVSFTLTGDPAGNGPDDARLSAREGLTDERGEVVLEVLVGSLPPDTTSSTITVQAVCPGTSGSQVDVLVTTNAYAVEVAPRVEDEILGTVSLAKIQLVLFDSTSCRDLTLWNLPAPTQRSRSVTIVPNDKTVFSGVAGQGSSAIVGLGLDAANVPQVGGCVDVPGSSLLDAYTLRVGLTLDRLFPVPLGDFAVQFDFQPTPSTQVPAALGVLQSTWQEWARCPFDPARLWLDCTIDAMATDPESDPNDCVPVAGEEGSLGARMMERRGEPVAPLATAGPYGAVTPCRGATDATGSPSLEALVDSLFASSRNQLAGLGLGKLAAEIANLLAAVRVSSSMTVTQGEEVNGYRVTHDLDQVTFLNTFDAAAGLPIAFTARTLGLLVSTQTGIGATARNGRLDIASHGFTLRLGSTTRSAFEATSIHARGSRDIGTFVNILMGLAQTTDSGRTVAGCLALDAKLGAELGLTKGTLLSPCQAGLDALVAKMVRAFQNLDGNDLDYVLSGSARLLDFDGNGLADAMGQTGPTAGKPDPAIWSAEIRSRLGSFSIIGQWSAYRVADAM